MARKTETREFERGDEESPVRFRVTQEGFATGRKVFVRVAKALGPAFALLAETTPNLRSLRLSPAIKSAVENLSDDDLEFLSQKFGDSTQFSIDGQKWPYLNQANREELFGGNLVLFFRWILFALEVNFGDFSAALSALSGSGREGATPTDSQESQKS